MTSTGTASSTWCGAPGARSCSRDQDAPGGWEERPQVVPACPDGPPTDFTDPHVFLADMTGDGTPDIVRVDGRAVTYWPYLGFGTFGEAVRMGGSPALPFDVDIERCLRGRSRR